MAERCEYCGRFMENIWYRTNDHDDSWVDYWSCSLSEKHKKDHPQDYQIEVVPI